MDNKNSHSKHFKKHFNFNVKSEEPLKIQKPSRRVLFGLDLNDQAKKSLSISWDQCSGSMTFGVDPDPIPRIHASD